MTPKPLQTVNSILLLAFLAITLAGTACSNSNSSEKNESDTPVSENTEDAKSDSQDTDTEEETPKKPEPIDWTQRPSVAINCAGSVMDLADPLRTVANSLESQNLMYNVQPFTDCSGIFHRVLDSINRRCPSHDFPNPKTHRSSRGVGQWYNEKGNFIKITDPENEWEYIKPGAVMFYVSGSVDPKTVATEALFKSGGIRHVGVVVDVEKDENGVVSKYTLFHGRTTGKVAAKTNYHSRIPSRSGYPPYGNGRDHWVGVAPIASDLVMDGQETQSNARTTYSPPPRTMITSSSAPEKDKTTTKDQVLNQKPTPTSAKPSPKSVNKPSGGSTSAKDLPTKTDKETSTQSLPKSKAEKSSKTGGSQVATNPTPKTPPKVKDLKVESKGKMEDQVASKGSTPSSPKEEQADIELSEWAKADGLTINCEGGDMNLALPLNQVADRLQAQNLMYNVRPFTDCSGIFHRVLDSLDRRCPSHAFPDPKTHRDSRSLARWYKEKGNFVQIKNPEEAWKYIKPGAVMFYAAGHIDPKTVTVDALLKPGGIRHIGVVVDVEKDKKGVVSKYTLFHGRTSGKPAAKTNYHTRKPSRSTYPAYGNGRDHWIGVAQIASDRIMDKAIAQNPGSKADKIPSSTTSNTEEKSTKEEKEHASSNSSSTPKESTQSTSTEPAQGGAIESPKEKPEEKTEEVDLEKWAEKGGLTIKCEGGKMDLALPLNQVADRLQAQNLMYNIRPFTDCSGIFHRVLDSLDRRCPAHAFPDPKTHRDSRSIGRWYKEKGNFVQVKNPESSWKYIKPGAVMFYAAGHIDPKTITVDALLKPGGIRHIGVVVDVEKDEKGVVTKYTLFHGRTSGKPAAKTNYHMRKPSRSSYPAYGNGRDHWIAVAQIASDKVMD